jgi:hypothetical protein
MMNTAAVITNARISNFPFASVEQRFDQVKQGDSCFSQG